MMNQNSTSGFDRISEAIEVFVEGFAETRSRTWTYESIQFDSVWQLKDKERKKESEYRKEEWIALDVAPSKVHELATSKSRGRYFICPIARLNDSVQSLKDEYRTLGYRLLATEPLFVHELNRISHCSSEAKIFQLKTEIQATEFAAATRTRAPRLETYSRKEYRQYLAYVDNSLVGWVRSIETSKGNWCSNLFVQPAFRRQGIAKSLLSTMLRDDRNCGSVQNVLLSSHTGAYLYPNLGYKQLGTLLILAPKK